MITNQKFYKVENQINLMSTVYVASGQGKGNLADALSGTPMDVRGKTVFLKPNMVDPTIPEACSNPERMQTVVDYLRAQGADKVLIGDEPAHYVYELNPPPFDLKGAYKTLGYHHLRGAELIDLADLNLTSFIAKRLDPKTTREVEIEVPVMSTAGMYVVSFTLPKHHGNFNYSGVTKNLMGLVPEESRIENFHYGFHNSIPDGGALRIQELALDFAPKFAQVRGLDIDDPKSHPAILAHQAWMDGTIDVTSLQQHFEQVINAGSIASLAEHVKNTSTGTMSVLDGTYLLSRHEHQGTPVQTDFALTGENPEAVDLLAMAKLGINPVEVPYVIQMLKEHVQVAGELGAALPTKSLLKKELFKDSHGLSFLRIAE
jgi:uncharacterized protein (DUF362 family)